MDTNFDGIVDKIQEILNKVRAPINKGIDKVLELIATDKVIIKQSTLALGSMI